MVMLPIATLRVGLRLIMIVEPLSSTVLSVEQLSPTIRGVVIFAKDSWDDKFYTGQEQLGQLLYSQREQSGQLLYALIQRCRSDLSDEGLQLSVAFP